MSNLDQTRYFTVELQQHDVRSPALILIGTVVSLHELLQPAVRMARRQLDITQTALTSSALACGTAC
ncbi:MAG TPA: hypothetical protein VII31_03800 [Caldimonas sp.]|jgi:hypothetical protein